MPREEIIRPTRRQIHDYAIKSTTVFSLRETSFHDFQYVTLAISPLTRVMPVAMFGKRGKVSLESNNAEVHVFAASFSRENIPEGLELIEVDRGKRLVQIDIDRDEHPAPNGYHNWQTNPVYL